MLCNVLIVLHLTKNNKKTQDQPPMKISIISKGVYYDQLIKRSTEGARHGD